MQTPEKSTPIALLTQAGEAGRHLRAALAGTGTPIVYEAQAAELDLDELEKSGARVVVVNLDNDVEDHLDDVYSLLGDDRYNVIFDEAQVSSQLSGWEQARWARHLASKILGTEDADPPRPEGAEPVPVREPAEQAELVAVSATGPTEADAASLDLRDPEPDPGSPVVDEAPEVSATVDAAAADADYSDIVDLLNEIDPEPLDARDSHAGASAFSEADEQDTVPMPVLDLSEFDDFDDAPVVDEGPDVGGDAPLAGEPTVQMPALELTDAGEGEGEGEGDALGFGDLDDFADGEDDSFGHAGESPPAVPERPVGSDLAESTDASEAAASGSEISELQMLDLDWADAPAPAADNAGGGEDEGVAVPPPTIGSAFAWSLEDLTDEASPDNPKSPEAPSGPAKFGIETISASDFLAPEGAEPVDDSFDAGLSLELIPLDEAVAPQVAGAASANQGGRETWLDTDIKIAVSRVWVLGASIGGPEAVREFLAELPAGSPALFLLAQHMGAEFMDIMAQQLVRSTALTVRTPSHGERVAHGDIVVVPTNHRLRVDREGVITLEPSVDASLPHSPSIDQVLRDVADRFGSKSGVIVFSGMAEDAAEGSIHMAAKGGKVYVQDPETCVISSMVDGVIDTGVVSFTGSPKALAEKVMGDMKSAAKA